MKKYNIYSSIITFLSLVAIISLILFVMYPAPIKPIIRKMIKSSNYPLSTNAETYDNYVLYEDKYENHNSRNVGGDDFALMDQAESSTNYKTASEHTQNLTEQEQTASNEQNTISEEANDANLITDIHNMNTRDIHNKVLSSNRSNIVLREANNTNVVNGDTLTDGTTSTDTRRDLIVFFIGGSFLFQDLSSHYGIGNKLYELMRPDNFDVMLLRYPVRFASTVQQAMLSINETLSKVMLKYKDFYAIGYSAGSLLASVFIQKEIDADYSNKIKIPRIGLHFRKFIGICGLYYPVFMDNMVLTKLFRYYILRSTLSPDMYTVMGTMESIPKLVISNTTDFLYGQTAKFIQTVPNTAYKIYTNTTLKHTFIENIDLVESKDAFELIRKFILQKTN